MKLERKVSSLPFVVIFLLIIAFGSQVAHKQFLSPPIIQFTDLEAPLTKSQYQLLSLGSIKLLAHLATLKLQLHDNQRGKHYNYHYLNYKQLTKRLVMLQMLNQNTDYPALLAARVFVNTTDKQQLKEILETVILLFELNPEGNWRWLAELTILSKYHLKDIKLALRMAKTLSKQPKSYDIPAWARDLEFLMLESLSQYDAAIYIVEQSLKHTDKLSNDEIRFLQKRLSALKQKSVGMSTK